MSKPGAHLSFQYQELNDITSALNTLERLGISALDPAIGVLNQARAAALGKLGLLQPRTTSLLKIITGLSPGEIRLFRDAELGWLVEAIERPGARPVRRYVSDEIAAQLLRGELTHELEQELFTPIEEYSA